MEKSLNEYISRDTKTVELMDKFERGQYDSLILEGFFHISDRNNLFFVAIKIKHHEIGNLDIEYSGMTFSDYKKRVVKKEFQIDNETPYSLVNFALKMIAEHEKEITSSEFKEFALTKPQTFSAQNSGDRSDYGYEWEHDGKDMVMIKQGTHYGDTTTYEVVSILIKRAPEMVFPTHSHEKKYKKYSKIVVEFNLSESEQQEIKNKYPKIEKKYIEVIGNKINWENTIDS